MSGYQIRSDKGSIEIPTVDGTAMGLIREWLGPASNPTSYLQGSLGWDSLSGPNRRCNPKNIRWRGVLSEIMRAICTIQTYKPT